MSQPEKATTDQATPPSRSFLARLRRRGVLPIVLLVGGNLALLALLIIQLLTPFAPAQPGTSGRPVSDGDFASPLLGRPAPDFTLTLLASHDTSAADASQSMLRLSDYKGRPIILNFWSSWCTPCNDEAAFLQRSWPTLNARGIALLGIDGHEKRDAALAFIRRYNITYPNAQDTLSSSTTIDYNVAGLPATIFINRHGTVVAHWIAPLNAHGLQSEMARLDAR
ncbi:hypothetical protein KDH_68720 [Dictyobacter sp. S3.2.2.5]|uniref:Thioredoxin domain-containing protein n=1 Tax=Dictyobacter halimunensis TaxID=3026934 RepID=A0ABQ6G0N1_9CHLR|nr:hypothetical protein KDH_68720 [Dictyobacter sp. S3.2.2.5]